MNNLPEHRRILWGRTHGKAWYPADMDPVRFYPNNHDKLAEWLLAAGIGAALGVTIFFYL